MRLSNEAGEVVAAICAWAERRADVRGLALVGSYARADAGPDSDVDIVMITDKLAPYLHSDDWAAELALGPIVRTRSWGPITERRLATASGLEVDLGIAPPSWAAVDPVDEGTQRVVADGLRVLYDPDRMLVRVLAAVTGPRPLLFMPDYSADPLWDLTDEHMVSLERLPISEAARMAVRGWAKRWDQLASVQFDESANPVPEHPWAELEREGRALWQRLQRELGPDWRVGWAAFPDGLGRHVQWEPDGPLEPCLPGTWNQQRSSQS